MGNGRGAAAKGLEQEQAEQRGDETERATDAGEERELTLRLSPDAVRALMEIAQRHDLGGDIGKAIEIALGSELFILRETEDGSRILVKRPNGRLERLDEKVR